MDATIDYYRINNKHLPIWVLLDLLTMAQEDIFCRESLQHVLGQREKISRVCSIVCLEIFLKMSLFKRPIDSGENNRFSDFFFPQDKYRKFS